MAIHFLSPFEVCMQIGGSKLCVCVCTQNLLFVHMFWTLRMFRFLYKSCVCPVVFMEQYIFRHMLCCNWGCFMHFHTLILHKETVSIDICMRGQLPDTHKPHPLPGIPLCAGASWPGGHPSANPLPGISLCVSVSWPWEYPSAPPISWHFSVWQCTMTRRTPMSPTPYLAFLCVLVYHDQEGTHQPMPGLWLLNLHSSTEISSSN